MSKSYEWKRHINLLISKRIFISIIIILKTGRRGGKLSCNQLFKKKKKIGTQLIMSKSSLSS